jgi:chemotaxis protein methyltransferase CheR
VKETENIDYYALTITDDEFELLQDFIVEETGILLNPRKRELVQNRLRPLLRERQLKTYGEYYEWLVRHQSMDEVHELIQSITTNKTEFFRNRFQIDYFRKSVIPHLVQMLENGQRASIRIWSAGCSSGEEPYSLAICCLEEAPPRYQRQFQLFASDIDRTILDRAKVGIYAASRLDKVAPAQAEKYFRQTGDEFRAAATVRGMVEFHEANLVDQETWPTGEFDVLFCRNVLIYMRQDIKRAIINKFHQVLKPGGYLFLGHSETLHGVEAPFEYIEPSIYRKE